MFKRLQKCHNIFLHILLFQNILSFFLYIEKKLAFFRSGGGGRPPAPLLKNASFFPPPPRMQFFLRALLGVL